MSDLIPFAVIAVLVGVFGIACYWVGWVECWLSERQKEHEKRKGVS